MLKRIWAYLNEYLRINAIRRMLAIVEVRRSEVGGLVGFAVLFAIFEGIGLALLLPILQYADGGQTAIIESSGIIWRAIADFMEFFHLPVTLPVLLAARLHPHPAAAGGVLLQRLVLGRRRHAHRHAPADADARRDPRRRPRVLLAALRRDISWASSSTQTAVGGMAILAVIKQLSIALLMLVYVAILLALSVPLTLSILFFAVMVSLAVRANIKRIRDVRAS